MSATQNLLEAYATWRQWTETEADALHSANWTVVAQCQEAKKTLQPIILQLTDDAWREWAEAGLNPAEAQQQVRQTIGALLALEQVNSQTLQEQIRRKSAEQAQLHQANHNLSRLHRSYRSASAAGWQSYS